MNLRLALISTELSQLLKYRHFTNNPVRQALGQLLV
jgi:hypothetical protein